MLNLHIWGKILSTVLPQSRPSTAALVLYQRALYECVQAERDILDLTDTLQIKLMSDVDAVRRLCGTALPADRGVQRALAHQKESGECCKRGECQQFFIEQCLELNDPTAALAYINNMAETTPLDNWNGAARCRFLMGLADAYRRLGQPEVFYAQLERLKIEFMELPRFDRQYEIENKYCTRRVVHEVPGMIAQDPDVERAARYLEKWSEHVHAKCPQFSYERERSNLAVAEAYVRLGRPETADHYLHMQYGLSSTVTAEEDLRYRYAEIYAQMGKLGGARLFLEEMLKKPASMGQYPSSRATWVDKILKAVRGIWGEKLAKQGLAAALAVCADPSLQKDAAVLYSIYIRLAWFYMEIGQRAEAAQCLENVWPAMTDLEAYKISTALEELIELWAEWPDLKTVRDQLDKIGRSLIGIDKEVYLSVWAAYRRARLLMVRRELAPYAGQNYDAGTAWERLLEMPDAADRRHGLALYLCNHLLQAAAGRADASEIWQKVLTALPKMTGHGMTGSDHILAHDFESTLVHVLGLPYELNITGMINALKTGWPSLSGTEWDSRCERTIKKLTIREAIAYPILLYALQWRVLPLDLALFAWRAKRPKTIEDIYPILELFHSPHEKAVEALVRRVAAALPRLPDKHQSTYMGHLTNFLSRSGLLYRSLASAGLEEEFNALISRPLTHEPLEFLHRKTELEQMLTGKAAAILGEKTVTADDTYRLTPDTFPELFRAVFQYQATHKDPLLKAVLAAYTHSWVRHGDRRLANEAAYAVLMESGINRRFTGKTEAERLWLTGIGPREFLVEPALTTREKVIEAVRSQWKSAMQALNRLMNHYEPGGLRQVLNDVMQSNPRLDPDQIARDIPIIELLTSDLTWPLNLDASKSHAVEQYRKEALHHLRNARTVHGSAESLGPQEVLVDVAYDILEILEMGVRMGGSCLDAYVGSNKKYAQGYVTHMGLRNLMVYKKSINSHTGAAAKGDPMGRISLARGQQGRSYKTQWGFTPVSRIYTDSVYDLSEPLVRYAREWARAMGKPFLLPKKIPTEGGGLEISWRPDDLPPASEATITITTGPSGMDTFYSDLDGVMDLPSRLKITAHIL